MQTLPNVPEIEPFQLLKQWLAVYGEDSVDPGIKVLAVNVLKQAIVDYGLAKYRQDALDWFSFDGYAFFSFRLVCDLLWLDPYEVRRLIRSLNRRITGHRMIALSRVEHPGARRRVSNDRLEDYPL